MKKIAVLCIVIAGSLVLSACGAITPATPTAVPTNTPEGPTSTPDPCSQANLPQTVKLVNDSMRKFDEYAALASSVVGSQLPQVVPPMQGIQRTVQDQAVPSCLNDLKRYALLYMNTTIQTLQSFEAGAKADALASGILQARKYHDDYVIELARLLGVTLNAPTPTVAKTSQAPGTPAAKPEPTGTPAAATVVNPGPNPLNMHVSASLTAETVATLVAGQSAKALGRTANQEWVLLEIPAEPGKLAWVYASLVQFTQGNLSSLPIQNP